MIPAYRHPKNAAMKSNPGGNIKSATLLRWGQCLQLGRDGHCPFVQRLVGQTCFLLAVSAQETEDLLIAHRGGALTQQINQTLASGEVQRGNVYLSLHYRSLVVAEIKRRGKIAVSTSLSQVVHNHYVS